MSQVSEYIWFLKFKISVQKRQLEAFRTGSKYVSLRKEYEAECGKLRRETDRLKHELAEAHSEITKMRRHWSEVFDDMEKEHNKEINLYKNKLSKMEARALKAEGRTDELKEKLKKERKEKYELGEQLEEAEGTIKKLTAQVNMDFSNSSVPSSQQGPGRKKIPNSRTKTENQRGGQPGHEGHRLTQKKPTETHHIPDPPEYSENPEYYKSSETIRRQKIVLSFDIKIVEYTASVFRNKTTGSRVHAEFPDGYDTDICYDSSVKAFVYLLANEGNMSAGKIRTVLREASGGKLDISEATINGLCKEFSMKSKKERDEIIRDIMASPVVNIDFTNANVNGKAKQVLVMASPQNGAYMYFARDSKGHKGIAGTPAENYVGTMIHDHDTTFYSYGMAHQECMQHNIRYIVGSEENEPDRTWNIKMHKLIQEMLHYKNQLGGKKPDPQIAEDFERRYDEILELAKTEYEYEPPSEYYREGFNLYQRLVKYKESELRFLHDEKVPANNSLAERLARVFKRKQKQMMVFRSDDNFGSLCDGLSVLNTYRQKEDTNLYEIVSEIFSRPAKQW